MRDTVSPVVEQPQLELAQLLLPGAIVLRDQRVHRHAARHRVAERLLDLGKIAAEDRHADRFLRLAQRAHDAGEPVDRKYEEVHNVGA